MAELYYAGNMNIYLYGDFALEIEDETEEFSTAYVSGVKTFVIYDYRKPQTTEEFIVPSYCEIYITRNEDNRIDSFEIVLKPFDKNLPDNKLLLDMGTAMNHQIQRYNEYIFVGKPSKFNKMWLAYMRLIDISEYC